MSSFDVRAAPAARSSSSGSRNAWWASATPSRTTASHRLHRARLGSASDLHLTVGLLCLVLGAEALVMPTRFVVSVLTPITASGVLVSVWGLTFLLGGTLLVGSSALALPRVVHVVASVGCAGLMLVVGYPSGSAHEWANAALCVSLALGTVAAAFSSRSDGPRSATIIDVLSLSVGAGLLMAGCVLTLVPASLPPTALTPMEAERPWFVVVFIAGGAALLACQLVSVNRLTTVVAHVFAAAALAAYCGRVLLPQHAWAAVALYGGLACALALQPWSRQRWRALEPSSLRVRLVLTLICVASVPLIVAVAAIADMAEAAALADAAIDQEVAARDISRAAIQFDSDYRRLVTTIATRGGLAEMTTDQQRDLLGGLVATDVFAFSTYDGDGQPRVRSDARELVPLPRSLVDMVRGGQPAAVELDTPAGADGREFVFAAPLYAADSQLVGFVAASIATSQIANDMERFGAVQRSNARMFIVNLAGQVILHSDPTVMRATPDLSRDVAVITAQQSEQASGAVQYRTVEGGLVAGFARVPDLNWVAVVTFPTVSILRGIQAGRELAFGVLLAAGVLSAALGLFVADRFIQPLSTLGKAAEGVAADGVLTPLPHSSFAEVDRLARLFGTMRQRLQARTEEREGALDAAREAIRVREEFVSVAAHELKTPVTALRGQAQLLLRQLDSFETLRPEQLRNGLSSIDRQSKRMARLIDQLLDVARLERDLLSLDPTDVDMRELVQEVVLTNAQDNRVVLNVCAADCIVRGDRLRLEQVLDNLIENAAKFSPQGGRIDVGVDVTDGAVHITIRDYGLGIPVQHRERIFERFYQAHATSHRSGLGLGLYIVKQIVDLHHGQIRFESPNDGGTLFVIDLPQARSRVAPAARGADC